MAVPQGWSESSGKYKNSPYYLKGNANTPFQLQTDPNTGNFTVSDGNGNPIYTIEADGGITISNPTAFNKFFEGEDGGDANFKNLNKSIKTDTLDIAGELGQGVKQNLEDQEEYKSLSNTEPNNQNENNNESNIPTNPDGTIKGKAGKGDTDASASGTGLVYPLSRRSDQDYIMFTSVDRCNNEFEKCTLPIQGGIADNNAVDYAGGKLNPLQEGAAGVIGGIIGGEDISKQIGTAKDKIAKDEGGIKKFIESAATASALGVSQDELLSRFKGAVVNPNLQLLFKGPTLRPFSFTFTLSPRSAAEARVVRKIVRFFKFNMAIQKTSGQLFLAEPRTFKIRYVNGDFPDSDHAGLNRIKRCALQACNVEYTPAGTYSRFNDQAGTMTQYKIGLQFQEIDPIYSEDYTNTESIGF